MNHYDFYDGLTVQELISLLSKVKDKSKPVYISQYPSDFGTTAQDIEETKDSITIK